MPRARQGALYRAHKTPEAYAESCFASMMLMVKRTTPLSEEYADVAREFPEIGAKWDQQFFGFDDAKRDLGVRGEKS
jgi:hypothetical protein